MKFRLKKKKVINFLLHQVSWVRQRDLHILTVGSYTYTSDQRFSCVRPDGGNEWNLEIKHLRKEDQGVYECQISTEPKMSFSVRLNVQGKKIN